MQHYVISFRAMGSQVNVWLRTAEDGAAILQQVPEWIEAIETSLSRFRPDSELTYLNAHTGEWVEVSPTMYAALTAAKRAARATNGLATPLVLPALLAAGYDRSFEVLQESSASLIAAKDVLTPERIDLPNQWDAIQLDLTGLRVLLPGPVDLGGTAKGWTAETIADRLAQYGPCLIDLGGDLVGCGSPWPVELHDPLQSETPFATFTLQDSAVATSGTDYRSWGAGRHHIIDPRTGEPAASDLVSVTVVYPDAVLAEAYAKAVLLEGSLDGLTWLAQQTNAAAVAFDQEGRVLATGNLQSDITQGA